jgi:hypothetical protein
MQLYEFRLTFIFNETVLGPLARDVPVEQMPRSFVLQRSGYQALFDGALQNWPAPHEPGPPWPKRGRQGFWLQYFEEKLQPSQISGGIAWHAATPIRFPAPIELSTSRASRVQTEGFVHPWGSSLVITVTALGPWMNVPDLGQLLFDLRWDPVFELGGSPVRLEEAGDAGLNLLRTGVFGALPPGQRRNEPFSIFTVLRGSGSAAELDPAQAPAVHALLQSAASFQPSWSESDVLPELASMRVAGRRTGPADHIVYGTSRGRAIWGPKHFLPTVRHTLSCQHRNLGLASMQMESLAAFVQVTARRQGSLTSDHKYFAQRGIEMLRRLYRGDPLSFRSKSLPAQLDATGAVADINELAAKLGRKPL